MNEACNSIIFTPPPAALRRGQKVKYHKISITESISKIFIPNFVCVLTNKRCKAYQTGFSLYYLSHATGLGLWGAGGAQGVKKIKHGHVTYQIDRNGEHQQHTSKISP